MNIFTFLASFAKNRLQQVVAVSMIVLALVSVSFLSSKVYAEDTVLDASTETVVAPEEVEAPAEPAVVIEEPTPVVEEVVQDEAPEAPATPVEETVSSETANVISSQGLVLTSPTLTTDKEDYHPGETASIFGKFFAPLQSFILKVFGSDENDQNYVESVQTVSADDTGSFSLTYLLDLVYRPFYEVVVTTLGGEKVAETWFRDSSITVYNQCSNDEGEGYTTGDMGCRWINGAINSSNSVYFEGDSTIHRTAIEGFAPNTSHTVTFKYGTTKGGHHAYDYLTSAGASESWVTEADLCQGIAGCTTASEGTASMGNDPQVPPSIEPDGSTRLFGIRGGNITAVTNPQMVSGSYAGDSETVVTVTFTVDGSGDMCTTKKVQGQDQTTCGVAIWFGAHIAESSEWTDYNQTTGAGSIQGSPYHVALASVDNVDATQGGGRDNQMSADVLVIPTQATLTLLKTVINDNGGTAVDTNWTLSANGPTSISGTEGQSAITNALVDAGVYTLSESAGPAGYTGGTYSCVINQGAPVVSNTLTLAANDVAVCTVTNNDIAPSLTLVKQVINDNGGNATAGQWTLTATGYDSQSPDAGTYNLSESNGPSGYAQTSLTCTDTGNTQVTSVTLSLGENVTCTFVNDDIAPKLKVVKVVDNGNTGSTNTSSDFQMLVDNNGVTQGVSNTYSVGAHTVTETGPSGYTATYSGACNGTPNVNLALGDDVTCTVTNTAIAPKLTLVKTVTNDNGGTKLVADFVLKIDATSVTSGVANVVTAGSHTASEVNLPGYTAGTWEGDCAANGSVTLALGENKTCTINNNDQPATLIVKKVLINDNGGTKAVTDFSYKVNAGGDVVFEADAQNDATVNAGVYTIVENAAAGYATTYDNCTALNIPNGGTATCTITNDDIAPKLHLRKVVINDNGGAKTVADFALTADGTAANDLSGTSPVDSGATLQADTFALSETVATGYSASTWSCVGGQQTGASIALGIGEEATCTITNDDIQPKLTLTKIVVNDNGGSAVVSDFPLFVGATGVTSGVQNGFNAGSYTASETNLAGYTAGAWTGDCAADGSITLNPGDVKACTITNDDQQAYIKVVKVVNNNHGGTATPNTFSLTLEGAPTTSGTLVPVNPGTYTAGETLVSGYTFDGFSGDCDSNGDVTVALGQTKTCTLTNSDIAPQLTVIKHVINDNGGTKVAGDFTMNVTATNPSDASFGGDENGTTITLDAGAFSVDEILASGYSKVSAVGCSGTIAIGEKKVCTITNDDIAPKLIVIKHVVNHGGTKVAGDFTMNVTGTDVSTPSFVGAENPGTQVTLDAGNYSVDENVNNDYTKTIGTNCSGTIALGETKTCTITNEEKPAKLTIIKDAQPNDLIDFAFNGGVLGAFSLDDDAGVDGADNVLSDTKVFPIINTGSYTITETQPNQYWVSKSISCVNNANQSTYPSNVSGTSVSVTLTPGSDVTCTFVNEKTSPTRTLGFWQTHTAFTSTKFAANPFYIGTNVAPASGTHKGIITDVQAPSSSQLFGGFFAPIAKTTTGAKRTAVDQARVQLLQQLIAAKLNCAAFGCSSSVSAMIALADTRYNAGTSASDILASASALDAYNNSGDTLIIGNAGSATPSLSKSTADLVFWNQP